METSLDSAPITKSQSPQRQATPAGFVQKRLPWIIATGFLVLYVVTLARSISYEGLMTLARAARWDWQLVYDAPLHFLVTYPLRWVSGASQVIAFNLFSAVCSVLTLCLLARSVAILPHDRTRDQRQLEQNEFSFLSVRLSWLPPIFAVLVCGLQLTFWEHSVVATLESFDLLLFAYCIRCLLEFRIDQRNSWLYRVALILGLAMTSNYAMIGFLPAFVIAMLWIKKRSFFNVRFLLTMTGLGLAGLLLFLLLPAINASSSMTDQSFWQLLKISVGHQKSQLLGFPRYVALLVALTSVLPVLFIGIKWPNQLGDISAVGTALTNLMTHVIHAVFMLACLYVAFDPPFSPRKLAFGQAMLPFYYLGALSVGYFAGYFLLVFGQSTFKRWERYRQLRTILNKAVLVLVCLAAVGVPVGLAVKNLPEIRKTTAPYLARMADHMVKSLPPEGGVVLSDDSARLYILQDALNRSGQSSRFILAHSAALERPAYQRYMREKHGERWPGQLVDLPLKRPIEASALINQVGLLSKSQRLFYLHPTFGYYLEYFYLEPRNLVFEMKQYARGAVAAPPIASDLMKENHDFWKQFIAGDLPALRQPKIKTTVKKGKRQEFKRNIATFAPASMYSRALTWFGVEAQKAGQLDDARQYFDAALELNPENTSAFVSRDFNTVLREGKTESTKFSEGAIELIARHNGRWQQIMALFGPVDDPLACHLVAQNFAQGGSYRQAAHYLTRNHELNPKAVEPRVLLTGILVQARFPDKALEMIEQIRNEPKEKPTSARVTMALIQSEAWAYVYKNDLAMAEKILNAADAKYPADDTPFSTLIEIYFRTQRTDRALALLDKELARDPNNASALINYSAIRMGDKKYEEALQLLDRAIKAEPDNAYARLNRAIAYLHLNRLDEAQQDYEHIISKQSRVPHNVYYGLAEVAWRKKLRKSALEHYTSYLRTAPPTPEREEVERRVKLLKSGEAI